MEKSKDATYTMNLNGKIDTVCLAAMKIIDVFPTFKFSTNIQSQFKLKDINDIEGYFALDSISLYNDKIKMNPENIILFAENTEDGKSIMLDSDFATMELEGQLNFNTLVNNIKYIISKELTNIPALKTEKKDCVKRLKKPLKTMII